MLGQSINCAPNDAARALGAPPCRLAETTGAHDHPCAFASDTMLGQSSNCLCNGGPCSKPPCRRPEAVGAQNARYVTAARHPRCVVVGRQCTAEGRDCVGCIVVEETSDDGWKPLWTKVLCDKGMHEVTQRFMRLVQRVGRKLPDTRHGIVDTSVLERACAPTRNQRTKRQCHSR